MNEQETRAEVIALMQVLIDLGDYTWHDLLALVNEATVKETSA